MRKYITEKVGILELFQIIFALLILGLGYYSFSLDLIWNRHVHKDGIKICAAVNTGVYNINSTALVQSECEKVLDINDMNLCLSTIQADYLSTLYQFKTPKGSTFEDRKKFILENMTRWQASEVTYLVLATCIGVALLVHMIVACCATTIEFRTKWNAAVQGIILFVAGFAAMLLNISANAVDNKYKLLTKEVRICSLLRFCDKVVQDYSPHGLSKPFKVLIDQTLDGHHACQSVTYKKAILALLIIIMVSCATMIFLAMDLVTKYEQESEEEEATIDDNRGVGSLVEDQDVDFDASSEAPGAAKGDSAKKDGEKPGPSRPEDSKKEKLDKPEKPLTHYQRSGDAVLSEYLHNKPGKT